MDAGGQFQQMVFDRAAGYFVMVWIVAAICTGLVASETKRRRFWIWFTLSILTGPVAWYLLFKWPKPVPDELAVACPHCQKRTRSDEKRCMYCKRLLVAPERDRAAQIGETAATVVFTARRLFGSARKAAEEQQRRRRPAEKRPPSQAADGAARPPEAKTPER
jgi:hypothetical protein